jgi:hypothetical protein
MTATDCTYSPVVGKALPQFDSSENEENSPDQKKQLTNQFQVSYTHRQTQECGSLLRVES